MAGFLGLEELEMPAGMFLLGEQSLSIQFIKFENEKVKRARYIYLHIRLSGARIPSKKSSPNLA